MTSRLAYKPTLALQDSHVAIYKIYVLKDPATDDVFYVGQTLKELETRLYGHMNESQEVNPGKSERIKGIIEQGGKPIIEAVDTIMGTCYSDKLFVNDREIFWIKFYKSKGAKLLNLASSHDDAESKAFKDYLKSIKAGQGDYRYYYCGRTIAGHEVYDEIKMRADGFALAQGDAELKVRVVEKIVEKIVERVVERVVVRVEEKLIYAEKPKVETAYFIQDLPEQPGWTPEFCASIPNDDYELVKMDYEEDESELELDECDDEPDDEEYDQSEYEDEEDNDESDFEPDCDDEQEPDEENEQPITYY